jgi:hypothetical protein
VPSAKPRARVRARNRIVFMPARIYGRVTGY